MCVNHLNNVTHLYISDTQGVSFSLSLENVLYYSPEGSGSNTLIRYGLAANLEGERASACGRAKALKPTVLVCSRGVVRSDFLPAAPSDANANANTER